MGVAHRIDGKLTSQAQERMGGRELQEPLWQEVLGNPFAVLLLSRTGFSILVLTASRKRPDWSSLGHVPHLA